MRTAKTQLPRIVVPILLSAIWAGASDACAQTETAAQPESSVTAESDNQAVIKPRWELHVPSARALVREARRSHSGVFFDRLGAWLSEIASTSAEGVNVEQARAVLEELKRWPDTAINAAIFAPDTEGKLRWAVRLNWPVADLHQRVQALLGSDAADELLEGVRLIPAAQRGYELTLEGSTLGYLLPLGESQSCLASHADLPVAGEPFTGAADTDSEPKPLLICRMNMTGTERDSGATFLSSFSVVTDIVYAGHVREDGQWAESVQVHWPPISGMGAKALFGRVKQTFFVPDAAFGALVLNAVMAPGMLDQIAGLGQQVMMEAPGRIEIVGEPTLGPIASNVESELCMTLLPGLGFLPMPDVVVQARTKRAERLVGDLKEATDAVNKLYREREQPEPWHEATVRDRQVYWSDGANRYPGVIMPLIMRPVLFTANETDAGGKERDFLVLGWTSTSPEGLVRRWLDLPRTKDLRHLPAERKTNGQVWLNWQRIYKWVSPYLAVPLGLMVGDSFLPGPEQVRSSLADGLVTARTRYEGLTVTHEGPVPIGALVVPVLMGASTGADTSGGSDLARERLASQRLKVLYHHAKLFKQDMGRWPAEIAELDGYVDFAGHPELLQLRLSSRKQWGEWFRDIIPAEDKEGEDDDDDGSPELDDKLFDIDWGRATWRLGIAPGTLEHLEALYIDQDGVIHRKEASNEEAGGKRQEAGV